MKPRIKSVSTNKLKHIGGLLVRGLTIGLAIREVAHYQRHMSWRESGLVDRK
jgi:hypothetical protein